MSYYMGDYYLQRRRGDYYRGDPGFLSFLGGIAKTAVGFIPGVGPALSAGLGAVMDKAAAPAAAATAGAITKPGFYSGASKVVAGVKGAVLKHPVLTGAGAAGVAAVAGAAAGATAVKHHLLGGGGRKRRRMRATNTKALRRALRRAYAFERIAMKTIHLVHPRKKGRFGGFKKPRRRAA